MLVAAHHDRRLVEWLAAGLAEVECRFAAQLVSDLPCVNDLVTHIERYRGKMLRPALVLVTGMACAPLAAPAPPGEPVAGSLAPAHRVVATVAEMVHMATLIHDDVLDEARTRRRGATINHLCGNESAVMLGDYLLSHAYSLCSSLNSPLVSRSFSDATQSVCSGELLQLANRNNLALDEPTYYEIIRRKTASLCGMCCRLGALLHDPRSPLGADLYAFGENVGMAFQIADDLLDLVGREDTVGKTLGRDLQKGKLTLPVIHYLRTTDPARRQRLLDLLHGVGAADLPAEAAADQAQRIGRLLADSPSVEYAAQRAASLIAKAKAALSNLPDSPARALLADMADAMVHREF